MKLYDKNAVAKFLDMTPKNVERLTQKGILQTKQGNLYALAETNRAYIKYLRDRNPESQEAVDLNEERAKLTKTKKHTRHLKKPLLEFQYNDSDTASLTIYLSAFLGVNPKKMQDKIDKYRKKGKILTLIIGGKKYGSQWVITGHSKDYEKFDNQGNLLIAKSTLSLEQYAKR